MRIGMCLVLVCMAAGAAFAGEAPTAGTHFDRVIQVLDACEAELGEMTAPAEAAAERLAAGGALYAAGQPSLVSELCGRAGGFMLIKSLGNNELQPNDVVLYGETAAKPLDAEPRLRDSEALVVVFGQDKTHAGEDTYYFSNHSTLAGVSPTLANAVPAWLFTGEMMAAFTRLGKMPVIYASIGIYHGIPRIYRYQREGVFWHESHNALPTPPGKVGHDYARAIRGMLRRCQREEADKLAKAAEWVREASQSGNRVIMYSMGHLFPAEVEQTAIGELFESAVWNSGFMDQKVPDHEYAPGDVLIHIGYQHPPYRMLDRAVPAGARVVYVDLYRHRDYAGNPDVLWIDPMWPWFDACVDLPGYDVPILAASGVVNGAIAWEIYRLSSGVSS